MATSAVDVVGRTAALNRCMLVTMQLSGFYSNTASPSQQAKG